MSQELILCRDLCKSYGGPNVLDHLELSVGPGRIVGLLGPNGEGKTTLIKLLCGLLQPSSGTVLVDGRHPGAETKAIVSYLPDRMYFADWMRTGDLLDLFEDFYADFRRVRAEEMCGVLGITRDQRVRTMSKGTKEKMQLILAMSREARLYLLDEPIAGVDPAARDFIMSTILTNYSPEGTVLLSTHLISDIERVLDEAIFLSKGKVVLHDTVDNIREERGKSVDALFREIFRMMPLEGGESHVG